MPVYVPTCLIQDKNVCYRAGACPFFLKHGEPCHRDLPDCYLVDSLVEEIRQELECQMDTLHTKSLGAQVDLEHRIGELEREIKEKDRSIAKLDKEIQERRD